MVDALGTVVRLGLAAVFLVSGVIKIIDPAQTRVAVLAYELLPTDLVGPVATGLPLAELALGTLLVAGAFTRWVALASGLLLLVLMAGMVQAWARGLTLQRLHTLPLQLVDKSSVFLSLQQEGGCKYLQ